ncbi:MAG: hypothetical protein KF779_01615 [Hyphomonadaceae bacterium]|nr:hypothetical protein [Hyphomonadaceae bacterium]
MKAAPAVAVALFLALVATAPKAHAATLAEALATYRNNHVAEAERQLGEVAADPAASAADRAAALRELGRIDGLVRAETDAIATAMAQTPGGEDACETAAVALRVYRDANQPAVPLAYAQTASAACRSASADALRVQRARTFLALALSEPNARTQHLIAAVAQLDGISEIARGAPDVASARFAVAMARRDADAALSAWQDYYWLSETDTPQALSQYAGRIHAMFAAAFAPDASDADVVALIELLVRAGWAPEARQFAAETNIAARAANDASWARSAAFLAFDQNVRAITLRANREMATTGQPAEWYIGEINAAMGALAQTLGVEGDPRVAFAEMFGIYGSLGDTGGYPSLHGGHFVQEEHIRVSQYGRSGEVRFIVIDHMVSNGFESWLWDGWAETGGWSSSDNAIVQIRSSYTDGPLNALRRTRPGPERERFLANNARAAADERAALGRDGLAQLPATSDRLEQQVYDRIAVQVGEDNEAFIAEVWRATNQTSIESHEGRHELDKANQPGLSDAQLEFRAKLSQIIFADYPRLGLASVAGGLMNESAHGIGNRRVLEGYRRWMRAHRNDIAGFDRSQPALSQLDKLTDEQIVAIARGMDPWAR